MRMILYIGMLLLHTSAVSATPGSCETIAKIPDSWTTKTINGEKLFTSSDNTASLSIECSILPKLFTDTEFAAYIGEEEPEESPPLRKFGMFSGRIWVINDKDLEWWLMKEQYMIHISLKSKNGVARKNMKQQVNDIVETLSIKQP